MGEIYIVGLGPGDISLISKGAMDLLKSSSRIFLRTEKHPIIEKLRGEINYTSLDDFYEREKNFEGVYESIAEFIVKESKNGDLVYAVPGHPRVAEKTVGLIEALALQNGVKTSTVASMSFVDAMFEYLALDPSNGFSLIDAFEMNETYLDVHKDLIITQTYDSFIASEVKLKLSEYYPYDKSIVIVKGAGIKGLESKKEVKLFELDRSENEFDYLTSLYVSKSEERQYNNIADLERVVSALRAPDGCEWDKAQTHESLKPFIIEEAYELNNAVDNEDDEEMVEELGDVLLQVVLHAQIGKEEGYFDLRDVVKSVCKKMIHRHPHVFNVELGLKSSPQTWEKLKKDEKGESTVTDGLIRIPKSLPALMKAEKVQRKAALVGFDWDEINDILEKIKEEYRELLDEIKPGNIKYIREELGDLIFSVVNLARFLNVDPEEAVNLTTDKFVRRFAYVEKKTIESGRKLEEMSLEEMDKYWDEAKKREIKQIKKDILSDI
ncbi:MAG: nucleoside triphosphate pyrophosphohydrolase [Clostridioides sp.]|jgi:tetrapyrrole methylase family protein/MazG family protein|nr:nucleoside triphosphate pyrophosphohydrolase [Clostridioides sp.]